MRPACPAFASKINSRQEVWVGCLSVLFGNRVPPSPTPSIFRITGLGMVWLVKSRCQRTYRSKSRKQRSYGRSLALLLRGSPSRSRCYCLSDYGRNRKRAQGQMSQGGCGKPACTVWRLGYDCTRRIENGGRPVVPLSPVPVRSRTPPEFLQALLRNNDRNWVRGRG